MSAFSGCFFFLFPYCPDLFGNEGTTLKATDQGRTSTSQIDDATATTDLTDILYWYFVLVPAKCTKFRKVFLIERFQQEGGVRVCGIALLGYFLVRCCGNFYFKVRYCGFQSPSGVR